MAEVSTTGKTQRNEDVARMLKEEGSELHYDTILDILNRGDRLRGKLLMMGYCVQNIICRINPRVTGNWNSATECFDPEKHSVTCDLMLTDEMRKMLEDVLVVVLGVKDGGARIGIVTDMATGKTDGTVTPDDDIIIDGNNIKVIPTDEEGLGVFFVDADGSEIPVTRRFVQNYPKQIICRVPALAVGEYTLKVVTRFTCGATLLNDPRTIVYELPIKVL